MLLCHLKRFVHALPDGNAGNHDDEFRPTILLVQFIHGLDIGVSLAHAGEIIASQEVHLCCATSLIHHVGRGKMRLSGKDIHHGFGGIRLEFLVFELQLHLCSPQNPHQWYGNLIPSLKAVIYTTLFHNGIRRMTRLYFRIYGKISAIYGTMPDIMIPFSTSHKDTVILMQNFTNFFLIFCHYANTILSCFSMLKHTDSRCGNLFSSIISGAASLIRLISSSKDSDSKANGISSQIATQT